MSVLIPRHVTSQSLRELPCVTLGQYSEGFVCGTSVAFKAPEAALRYGVL